MIAGRIIGALAAIRLGDGALRPFTCAVSLASNFNKPTRNNQNKEKSTHVCSLIPHTNLTSPNLLPFVDFAQYPCNDATPIPTHATETKRDVTKKTMNPPMKNPLWVRKAPAATSSK